MNLVTAPLESTGLPGTTSGRETSKAVATASTLRSTLRTVRRTLCSGLMKNGANISVVLPQEASRTCQDTFKKAFGVDDKKE